MPYTANVRKASAILKGHKQMTTKLLFDADKCIKSIIFKFLKVITIYDYYYFIIIINTITILFIIYKLI